MNQHNSNEKNNNINTNQTMFGQRSGIEDITSRLDQMFVDMNVEMMDTQQHQQSEQQLINNNYNNQESQNINFISDNQSGLISSQCTTNINQDDYNDVDAEIDENYYNNCSALMEHDESIAINQQQKQLNNNNINQRQQQQQQQIENQQQQLNMSPILIVTNVDLTIFHDKQMKTNFESLFLAFDSNITFRYLKSFRRVRIDFTDPIKAEQARLKLNNYHLGNTSFKCYSVKIIKPNYLTTTTTMGGGNIINDNNNYGDYENSNNNLNNSVYLNIPKLTKQFLISPPASPPVGWKPSEEQSPCIDVQLLSAIVNLCPGKVHEIHPGNESQPGIYVEVCEEPKFENPSGKTCSRIPKTMSPAGFCQQANLSG